MSVLIKNGLVITHAGSIEADVLIEGERVSALMARGSEGTADEVIDAAGKYVIPAESMSTRTWSSRSGAPSHPTVSRRARGRPHGAAPPRSSISQSNQKAVP